MENRVEGPGDVWFPTMNLRLKLKNVRSEYANKNVTVSILEQEFRCTNGNSEWREVPVGVVEDEWAKS